MNRTRALVIAGFCLMLAIAIGVFARNARSERAQATRFDLAAMHGTPLDPPKTARDFTLINGDGVPAHLIDPRSVATMLFFGYTHCPDACPLALASLGKAYRRLDATRAARTRIVFVTVDPARDTPSVARRYVRNFDKNIVALTGSSAQLGPVWDAYGVRVDARTHEIGHGDAIYAIANGRVVLVYPPNVSAEDLAADLRAL